VVSGVAEPKAALLLTPTPNQRQPANHPPINPPTCQYDSSAVDDADAILLLIHTPSDHLCEQWQWMGGRQRNMGGCVALDRTAAACITKYSLRPVYETQSFTCTFTFTHPCNQHSPNLADSGPVIAAHHIQQAVLQPNLGCLLRVISHAGRLVLGLWVQFVGWWLGCKGRGERAEVCFL